MNGYGRSLTPYLWIKAYWMVFGILLLIIASILSVRETETGLKKRIAFSIQRLTKPTQKFALSALLVFALLGGFIFYNTNILNKYESTADRLKFRADYEKALKRFEYLPQPKITNVNLHIELFPKNSDYITEGFYTLTNKQKEPIYKIYLQKSMESEIDLEVSFEGGAVADTEYDEYGFYIYTLNKPLQIGHSIKMNFKQTSRTIGFKENNSNMGVLQNGTFLTNKAFPTLGYNKEYELDENKIRGEFKLPPTKGMAKRNDKMELTYSGVGGNADLINFEVTIGTDKGQKAISSGNLIKNWIADNRYYFHYKTDNPIVNQYAIASANYEVSKNKWFPKNDRLANPIAIEIYYHKGHEYNLGRMTEAIKLSLDYFSSNYGSYQQKNMRILETPNYAEQIDYFSGTIPFSEAKEFMLDIKDEKDVDVVLYKTAHELAHQWWGMQIQPANVQGKNMILETLAQYSALMVMKMKYPKEKIEQLLLKELETYLQAKKKYGNQEVPLVYVEKQDYIFNAKGILVMYALQNYIGEKNVNLVLKRFIEDWNSYKGKLKAKNNNYTTTKDLLVYFNEVTPDSLRHKVNNLFEKTELNNDLFK